VNKIHFVSIKIILILIKLQRLIVKKNRNRSFDRFLGYPDTLMSGSNDAD